ncbi:hypothetical protein Ccrd_024748 [Cynara cardunculus var. scolymus]|uniref:LETM1-like protein n=1 Tax=Cynara cardunculus var. scolymus TaxID=59895 RepID=A0A103XDU9_CYNCS|nr:hypothetical protein Ccrd_024748 [Cynara cardunculus var. scolymus]
MDVSQFHGLPNASCSPSISQWKSLNPWVSCKHYQSCFFHKDVVDLGYLPFSRVHSRKRYQINLSLLEDGSLTSSSRLVDLQFLCLSHRKSRRTGHLLSFASVDDSITVNGSPQASTSGDIEEMQVELDKSLQNEDYNSALVQSLHDAARVFELAIRSQTSVSQLPWFPTAWLGIDQNAWLKTLSYQASVLSLLQAACKISSRGNGRDSDMNVFVRQSMSRLCATLEIVISEALSEKQPELYEWFWSEQVPMALSGFVNHFEEDERFAAVTGMINRRTSSAMDPGESLLPVFALSCIAAITKLGPLKISCAQFYTALPDITGRLMDMLVELVPIRKAYHSIKDMGLRREFLVHFGPRAAACRVKDDQGTEEVLFWVSLVQKQLQQAIGRERIWSRLITSEGIEVLDKDLAIFGFFIALGRSTQRFLCANNFEGVPEPFEGLIRYLIGGSVLHYPQLSSISSFQLYVEVVCEELDWLPFYPGVENLKLSHGHGSKQGPPNEEAISFALNVCSHWIRSFIKYSKWVENPSNVKSARFLSRGHNILTRSMEELGLPKKLMIENSATNMLEIAGSRSYAPSREDLDSFDKALESVDEALLRLEELLQERHVSSSDPGKEHLKAACSDLEKIRKLKKEAEFLEASFRVKADSLQQGNDAGRPESSVSNKRQSNIEMDGSSRKPGGLWSFLIRRPSPSPTPNLQSATVYRSDNTHVPEANEIQRFELLRNELKELERRVERSAKRSNNEEEEINMAGDLVMYSDKAEGIQVIKAQEKENTIGKYLNKLKETTTVTLDFGQRKYVESIDAAAATGLLIRVLTGDGLMEKEKQALRRTLTDLASVIPIGFLMLLPIPSTYGPERLALLRQLKKVKEMGTTEVNATANADES